MYYKKDYYDMLNGIEISKRKRCLLRRAIQREITYLRTTRGSRYNIKKEETLDTNLRDLRNLLEDLNLKKL